MMRRVKYLQRDNKKEKEIKLRHNNNEDVLKVLINDAHNINFSNPDKIFFVLRVFSIIYLSLVLYWNKCNGTYNGQSKMIAYIRNILNANAFSNIKSIEIRFENSVVKKLYL